HWGVHQKTRDFMLEYHHPYSNRRFVIERWREIVLRDFWFYNSLDSADEAFSILIDISRNLLKSDLSDELSEAIIETLLEFTDKLSVEETVRNSVIHQCLDVLQESLATRELNVIHNSRYFKRYLANTAQLPEFSQQVFELTKTVLSKSLDSWESTSHVEDWFEEKMDLFGRDYTQTVSLVGEPFFRETRAQITHAEEWQHLTDIPSFDGIANYFHQTSNQLDTALERIYFIVYLLKLPGMNLLKDSLLWDINRLLGNVHNELDIDQIVAFAGNLLNLFEELKTEHTATVLDCLLTLGKEVIDTHDQKIVDMLQDELVHFGFITPGEISITPDWQVQADINHVKNIRVWMELIGHAPPMMNDLLSALIVNLRLGSIFTADTDLFQRDVTKLLNSNIAPVYKQVKELARIFPVYFSEIGAEGELRDVTTAVDEQAHRRDRLIHFLRKQTHTESNSTHMELTRRVIRFWFDGNINPLSELVPDDVLRSINGEGEWFTPVHEIVQQLCQQCNRTPEQVLDLSFDELRSRLSRISPYEERDKQRVEFLVRIYALLREKYSFETSDIVATLRRHRFFSDEDVEELAKLLVSDDKEAALKRVYHLMGNLKDVIINPENSEASETIYYKRHVAAGIPSMYGEYREPKFEALGLTFRLERVASRLIDQIIEDMQRDYITTSTLRQICNILFLFQEGLELDGISHSGFKSNLRMLESSFTSASCSLDQYVNIFEFLEQNVKEIIDEYFLKPYDQPLRVVVPQLIEDARGFSEGQIRQELHKRSEEFYRDILSSAFLIQTLDNFLSGIIAALRSTADHFPGDLIHDIMTYDPSIIISSLSESTPSMDNQIFLGAKAFFLKQMNNSGLPVPEGFVLTTELFRHKEAIIKHPQINREIDKLIRNNMAKLEQATGKQFGNPENPLLLSVRAGTAVSMPGAMSTFLNVGMNDEVAEGLARQPGFGRTAWDCYRRFLQSWGTTHGISREEFDTINANFESKYNVMRNIDFTSDQMKEIAQKYKKVLQEHDIRIHDEPYKQLRRAVLDVLDSWSSERAIVYRQHLQIADEWGTAVIIQKMVLGNFSTNSGTGVLFTHDPYENKPGINIYGDYAQCGQGEDIVTGWLHTLPVTEYHCQKYHYESGSSLETAFPEIFDKLLEISTQLVEDQHLGPQEIEFTFEGENADDLYILQTRRQDIQKPAKRAVFRVTPDQLELAGRGIGIGGGALSGILAFNSDD
ncbi:MAG: pyruvate phosphate dikinase, partial [Chloroflexi bacterium]|nr:pyruvate phosphate dikinase [Chloroflexota bacterium]